MAEGKYTYEQLSEICDRLQRQVSRHIIVEQDLIDTRDKLDRELARFRIIQAYNDKALKAATLEELTTISLESIVDAFEFELAAIFKRAETGLEVVGRFGLPTDPTLLPFERDWLPGETSKIFGADSKLLSEWSELGLEQVIACPFFDNEKRLYGVVLGGRTKARAEYFEEIKAEVQSSFTVMVQQVGALWLNMNLNVVMQQRKYSVLFHRSNDGIVLVDMEGRIVNTNQRALELLGYTNDEMTALTVFDLSPKDELHIAKAEFEKLGKEGSIRFEICCLKKDGEMFPAEISGSMFELDDKPMIHGLIRDITELKRSQRKVIESERLAALGQLIAGIAHEINTPIGVIGASIGNISSSLESTLSRLPMLINALPTGLLSDFFALLERARQVATPLTSREERQHKRNVRSVLEEAQIGDADDVADTLVDMGIIDDVDPILPLLRSDVPGVLDAAYALSSLQRNSDNIRTAVERASKVVFALKKFAHRDHSGKRIPADIADGLETVLTLYHNLLKQGVEITRHFEPMDPVPCFPDELNQVWTNLLHNALQAMDYKGRIEVGVRRNGDSAIVTICDSGPGIPVDVRDQIFEPFFTTKPAGEGSGLGLDICKKIIEKHAGSIEVDSRPGRTEFRVAIPTSVVGDG